MKGVGFSRGIKYISFVSYSALASQDKYIVDQNKIIIYDMQR